jgi:signal transduction histidine kinase
MNWFHMSWINVLRRSRFVLPLAIAVALALIVLSELSYRESVTTLNRLGGLGAARLNVQALSQGIVDAETGQRGYLLTGRREYLQPYENAIKQINESFNFLRQYYANEPEPMKVVDELRKVAQTKLSEIAVTIELHDAGKSQASTEIVLTDIGKEQMEAVRSLSAVLIEHESQRVAKSRTDIYQVLLVSRIGVAALSLLGLLALFMYMRQTLALKDQDLAQRRLVQGERDRLEVEVARRTAELTELTRHLQTAREDERGRLARDLHDELGALLTSAKLDAARIKSRLAGSAPEAQERLAHLVDTLNNGIALKRRIIEDLRPSSLSNLGLVATLEILAREFSERSGLPVHCLLAPVRASSQTDIVIYRVVQEALTNIAKHARASQVWIDLSTQQGQLTVSVRDDGSGFNASGLSTAGHGLLGMRHRVVAEGGMLQIKSSPGQGTTIAIGLPEIGPIEGVQAIASAAPAVAPGSAGSDAHLGTDLRALP